MTFDFENNKENFLSEKFRFFSHAIGLRIDNSRQSVICAM